MSGVVTIELHPSRTGNAEDKNTKISSRHGREPDSVKRVGNTSSSLRGKPCQLLFAVAIVGTFVNVVIASAILFGLNVIYAETVRIYDAPRREVSIVITLFSIAYVISGLVGREFMRRYGVGSTSVVMGIIGCVGFLGAAYSPNVHVFMASFGILGGFGNGLFGLAFFTPLRLLNTEKRQKLVTAILTVAVGCGHATGSLCLQFMFSNFGYRAALIIIGGLYLQSCVGNMAVWANERKRNVQMEKSAIQDWKQQLVIAFKNRMFIIYIITDSLRSFVVNSYQTVLVDHVITLGFDREVGAYFAFWYGVSALVGRILNGIIVSFKTWHGIYHYSILTFLYGLCVAVVVVLHSYNGLLVVNCFLGLIGGALSEYIFLLLYEILSPECYTLGAVIHLVLFGVLMSISGTIAGWIRDITGSYRSLFYLALPLCATAAVVFSGCQMFRTSKRKRKHSLRRETTE